MSETQKVIEIEVLRYLPESDQAPHSEVYKVPFTDDMSVLQGAQYIKDNFDGSRLKICGVASAELVPIRSAGKANGVSGFRIIEPALLERIGSIRLFRWREADLFADWYVFTVFVLCVEMLVIKLLIMLHDVSSIGLPPRVGGGGNRKGSASDEHRPRFAKMSARN